MAPPRAAQDDDLDDLDDLLDEFNPTPAPSSSAALAASAPAPTASATSTPAPPASTADTDDFPDPDDDDLSALDADLVKDLEQGMASLFSGMEGGDGDEDEFKRIMEQLMKGEMGMPAAGSTDAAAAPGAGDEEGMAELLAALQMGAKGKGKAGGASAPKGSSSAAADPSTGGAPGNFQDTIAAAMAKMKDSGAKVDQETEAKAAAGGDPLAAMMAQMAGMGGGDFGGEEGLQGMLDEMMSQLISRDVLYEPLKELRDKYPAYLETNASTLPEADLKRYKEQQATVIEIVAKFDEPGADAEGPFSPEEEAKQAERHADIVALVAKMNEAGSPPKEIMGEMPPGMDLGPGGVPKVPDECCIC